MITHRSASDTLAGAWPGAEESSLLQFRNVLLICKRDGETGAPAGSSARARILLGSPLLAVRELLSVGVCGLDQIGTFTFARKLGGGSLSCELVADSEDGVVPQHARAGVAHHRLRLLPQCRLVTMDWTVRTGGLVITVGTFLQPLPRVGLKPGALETQAALRAVLVAAEQPYHRLDGLALSVGSPRCGVHG
jgi:hypothetical protein